MPESRWHLVYLRVSAACRAINYQDQLPCSIHDERTCAIIALTKHPREKCRSRNAGSLHLVQESDLLYSGAEVGFILYEDRKSRYDEDAGKSA